MTRNRLTYDRGNRWGRPANPRSRRQQVFGQLFRAEIGAKVTILHSFEDSCSGGDGRNCSLIARVYEYMRLTGSKFSAIHSGLKRPAYNGVGRPRRARDVLLIVKLTPEVRSCIHRSHRTGLCPADRRETAAALGEGTR